MQRRSKLSSALALMAALAAVGLAADTAMAQATGTVRGQVVDAATLAPLAGVEVHVQGLSLGGITNARGIYMIMNVPVGSQTISVNMLGYARTEATVTVSAGQAVERDFRLSQSAIELDALIVTGTPGAVQKRTLGNSVSSVNAEELAEAAPITTITQMLTGRTPGLTIMPPSGQVGTAANFRIRGASSLSAGNHPVFYVDGVRIRSGSQGGFGTGNNTTRETSYLDGLNPDDIESIEVIKGPAAATLYGADAAAGVIQIITKKGRAGQQAVQWALRTEFGQSDWNTPMPTNYTLCTPARIASSAWPGCNGQEPGTLLSDQPLKGRMDPSDPASDPVLRTGEVTRYALSGRGGGDRYSFFFSGDRHEEQGVFRNNYMNRTSGRANFTVLPMEHLDLAFSFQYSKTDSRQPNNDNSSNGWLRNAYRGLPGNNAPWAEGWRGLGPEQIAQYDNTIANERFVVGATVNHNPVEWFRHRLTAGMDAGDRVNTLFYGIDRTGRAPFGTGVANGYISHFMPTTRDYTVDYAGTLDFDVTSTISSSSSFGMQYLAQNYVDRQVVGEGLVADPVRLISSAAESRAYEGQSENRSLGFFAQEQIGYMNRLFVTVGVRMDDHSAFGANFSRIYYPKAQVAWVLSEEPFFNVPMVDHIKLRGAFGTAGNAPSPFAADRTYEAGTVLLADGTITSALSPDAFGNPDLRAERGQELEVGFDASLFGDAVGLELTYYDTHTKDALLSVPVAPSTGFTGSVLKNAGEVANSGFEIAAFGSPVQTPRFTWDTRISLSTNKNELVSLGGTRDFIPVGYRSSQRHAEGYPLAGYWAAEVLRNPDGSLQLASNGRPILSDDMFYVGPSAPTREMALTNTFTLPGGLQFYVHTDYKGGHYLFNMAGQTAVADGNAYIANDPTIASDSEEWLIARYGGNMPYMEKADFVKLREVSLRYGLPSSWADRIRVQDMSITLAGRNLATWSDYSGSDPEINIGGSATFTRADYMSVPPMRTLMASLDVRF